MKEEQEEGDLTVGEQCGVSGQQAQATGRSAHDAAAVVIARQLVHDIW